MSDHEGQTPETQNAEAEPAEPGSLDAAALAFKTSAPEPTDEAAPDPEPADETEAEAQEADPQEEPEAEELAEVEYEGKTYKLPPELQKAVLRQADYSRRMAEVQAKEKRYEQGAQTVELLTKTAEKRAEVLAEVKALDAKIAAYKGIDWAKAKAENPADAALAAVELLSLQDERREVQTRAKDIEREFHEGQMKALNEKREAMHQALAKELKGWGEELGTAITRYALDKGYTEADLQQVTDPRWVVAMDKARRFDALQAGKADIKARAQSAPPVLKPGAARQAPDAKSEALAKLRKSGTMDDATAAFRSRMR